MLKLLTTNAKEISRFALVNSIVCLIRYLSYSHGGWNTFLAYAIYLDLRLKATDLEIGMDECGFCTKLPCLEVFCSDI